MDLPDCPPGAEGYEDTVTEMPKKPEESSTKAEQEFLEYLNCLKVKVEDGESRSVVERRGRDPSGKWLYLCFPCSAVCSGEAIMQTHILGKKHKNRMDGQKVWTKTFFDSHPFNQQQQQQQPGKPFTEKNVNKIAKEAEHNSLESKFSKYRAPCEIQEAMETVKVPMLGVEYMVEFPAEQSYYKPSYLCTLCNKQAHPRTILNHMICFRHTYNYLKRHYTKATQALGPYWGKMKYREGVGVVINRLASRVEDTYGRMRPLLIDKDEFENNKDSIMQWITQSNHYSENNGSTFEEVVDVDLINTLENIHAEKGKNLENEDKKEPSPPVVAAPAKPLFNNFTKGFNVQRSAGRQERRAGSAESLSDISDDVKDEHADLLKHDAIKKDKGEGQYKARFAPYPAAGRGASPPHARDPDYRHSPEHVHRYPKRAGNYEYKVKLARDQCAAVETSAKKTFTYHEKNPEKHPLYPEEWKKFWNRRYKELQSEGKDPSKHDFKPEWIQFWTKRMKEIHEEEMRIKVAEIYRKLCVTPPDMNKNASVERPVEPKKRSPEPKRRSPEPKWRMQESQRRSPNTKRRSIDSRRRSPERRRSVERRPEYRREYRRERRSPGAHHHSPPRRRSPPRQQRRERSRSPHHRLRSPARASRSPLSRRESPHAGRNRTPRRHAPAPLAPSMQTVLISDDELKPDEDLSPWNSADEMPSRSPARSRTGSVMSGRAGRAGRAPHDAHAHVPRAAPLDSAELGPAENVVATLRLLVALEDHLGSLGPKVVDLLAEALKMEKDKANSSEELLLRENAVVLLETAKEKLKGAAQAGLVPGGALGAVRAAVVRVAATLHEADLRNRKRELSKEKKESEKAAVPVAGVGEVDRAQIAAQMAEALVAQGKTDVTSEELAQLVDAVIGMAEAKKREADTSRKQEPSRTHSDTAKYVSKAKSTVSALQLLQSAYDDNEKRQGKEDGSDAMDGLSDSDLETLLKNFNELSAEEQHSLIAYLKKLEAKEPLRVERLRQYVNAAVTTAPRPDEEPPKRQSPQTVAIESDDDDDYTVEEIFKSAKEKVKEDQIRQEMEIVKKSLEETKPVEVPKTSTIIDLTNSLSSASDILALVQASIQSNAQAAPVAIATTPEVVNTNIQPKSFGDPPDVQQSIMPALNQAPPPLVHQNIPYNPPPVAPQQTNYNMGNNNPPPNQQNFIRPQHNQMNYGGNRNVPQNDNYNQPRWNERPMNNMQDNRGPRMQGQSNFDNYNQGGFNQGPPPNPNFYKSRPDFEPRAQNKNQHYGNYNPQNNFRGRGQYGGQGRGRGRGGYY